MDNDGSLPSQFRSPRHELTSLGKFIKQYKVIMNSVLSNRSPFMDEFPDRVHYDCSMIFPQFGIVNFWVLHNPKNIHSLCVFDCLGNLITEVGAVNEAQAMSLRDDGYLWWCADGDLDPKLLAHRDLFDSCVATERKMRSILPPAVWTEMMQAKEDTEIELANLDGPPDM